MNKNKMISNDYWSQVRVERKIKKVEKLKTKIKLYLFSDYKNDNKH